MSNMQQQSMHRAEAESDRGGGPDGAHEDGHGGRPGPRPRRRFRLAMPLALLALVALALWGIMGRRSSEARLETWTRAQAVPSVRLIAPTPDRSTQTVVLPGSVAAWYDAPIYARVNGYLKEWRKDIGAHVTQGEVLATIDTPDLDQQYEQAKADLARAKADEALAELTARRWKMLLKSNAVSQQAADEREGDAEAKRAAVLAAQANVDRLRTLEGFRVLVAPFTGVVTARRTDVGDLIDAGSGRGPELFRVSDIHQMRVYVQVPQYYAAQLALGLPATLHLPQYPDETFPAHLITTSQAVSESTRTILAELVADNPDEKLQPGAYAKVHFHLPPPADRLQIPASAVVFRAQGTQVAVLGPDNKVELKPVRLGRDLGTGIEVLSGLAATDRVIDTPPADIESGDVVRVAGSEGDNRLAEARE
jgi:RND family efflux transporter MFP subunit